jgi:hypothetical protein
MGDVDDRIDTCAHHAVIRSVDVSFIDDGSDDKSKTGESPWPNQKAVEEPVTASAVRCDIGMKANR